LSVLLMVGHCVSSLGFYPGVDFFFWGGANGLTYPRGKTRPWTSIILLYILSFRVVVVWIYKSNVIDYGNISGELVKEGYCKLSTVRNGNNFGVATQPSTTPNFRYMCN